VLLGLTEAQWIALACVAAGGGWWVAARAAGGEQGAWR